MLQGLIVFDGSSQGIENFNFQDESLKECEQFLLSRNGDAFGRKNNKEIFKQFGNIITLGAPAYDIIFYMKENSVVNILTCCLWAL